MMGDAVMSERPSYRWENKELLMNAIMNQLGITEEDLEREPSWTKAKIREANIEKVLEKN
jgi:hypothetical protein